jgi:hypothetical protein
MLIFIKKTALKRLKSGFLEKAFLSSAIHQFAGN